MKVCKYSTIILNWTLFTCMFLIKNTPIDITYGCDASYSTEILWLPSAKSSVVPTTRWKGIFFHWPNPLHHPYAWHNMLYYIFVSMHNKFHWDSRFWSCFQGEWIAYGILVNFRVPCGDMWWSVSTLLRTWVKCSIYFESDVILFCLKRWHIFSYVHNHYFLVILNACVKHQFEWSLWWMSGWYPRFDYEVSCCTSSFCQVQGEVHN